MYGSTAPAVSRYHTEMDPPAAQPQSPQDPGRWRTPHMQAQLIELAPAAILVRELGSGVIVFWNPSAEEIYGWSSSEALGQISHQLLKTEFPQPLAEIEAVLARDGRWMGELGHTTRAGQRIQVAGRWAVAHDEQGAPAAYLEINTDVTEQRRVQAE